MNISKLTNCPNCGAYITNNKCEYCGTSFKLDYEPDEEYIVVTDSMGNKYTERYKR